MTLEERAKAQLRDIGREIETLQQRERDLHLQEDVIKKLLEGNSEPQLQRTSLTKAEVILEKHKALESGSVRASIIRILDEEPRKFFSAYEMKDELLRRGVKTDAKNFKHSVKTTLNILTGKGMVKDKEGKNMKLYSSIHNPEN